MRVFTIFMMKWIVIPNKGDCLKNTFTVTQLQDFWICDEFREELEDLETGRKVFRKATQQLQRQSALPAC